MSDEPITPRQEAEAAGEWWKSRLGVAIHDTGDDGLTATIDAMTRSRGSSFSMEQRVTFGREVALAVERHLQALDDDWRPDEPRWCSLLRCFGTEYGPDPILREAAGRAGLAVKSFDLPMKTRMWVDPGRVMVAEGYRADRVTIWQMPEDASSDA